MHVKPLCVLGIQKEDEEYTLRPGVYALPLRINSHTAAKEVGIIRICNERFPEGKYVLLGGGIEEMDDSEHDRAMMREIKEEIGYSAKMGVFLGRVDEYFYSSSLEHYFKKEGYFYKVDLLEADFIPVEKDHTLEWMEIGDAHEKVHHLSAKHVLMLLTGEI